MLPTSCSVFALVTNSSGEKKNLQAIYEWKKKVTLEYYSLQIIHALFHASSLSIHQNFLLHPGLGNKLLLIFIFLYCTQGIIYKESHILLVHGQGTELQRSKAAGSRAMGLQAALLGKGGKFTEEIRLLPTQWGKARLQRTLLLQTLWLLKGGPWKAGCSSHRPQPSSTPHQHGGSQHPGEPPCTQPTAQPLRARCLPSAHPGHSALSWGRQDSDTVERFGLSTGWSKAPWPCRVRGAVGGVRGRQTRAPAHRLSHCMWQVPDGSLHA